MKQETIQSLRNISFLRFFKKPLLWGYYKYLTIQEKRRYRWMQKQQMMIDPCSEKRQKYWTKCGAHINGQINIGSYVYFDAKNANHIYIEEGAWITSRCLLLCHKRDISDYRKGTDINQMPYIFGDIHIGKGVHIGMDSIIMPGVTIGDGAIIGAGSLVTKDIPAWTVAVGRPAKVVKEIE